MAIDEIVGWAYQSDFEYDVPCWATIIRPDKPNRKFQDYKIQYNQAVNDPYWCTRYGAMTCVTNNWDIDWMDIDFDYIRAKAPSYWFKDWVGMYTSKAGDMVVDYLNKLHPEHNWIKETFNTYESANQIIELMKKWWMIHFSSQINQVYTNTILDGVIEEPRGTDGSGHARSLCKSSGEREVIIENYVDWLPYNVIDIKDFKKLLEAKQFHRQVFIYYPTTNMTEIPYPYMTLDEANALESKYPLLFTPNFSESVRAWIDASKAGKIVWKYRNYKGIDGVMKMMIDLWAIR